MTDLLLINGKLHTQDARYPEATAVAIRGARVQAVGDDEAIGALAGPGARVIDLEGRLLLPAMTDSHFHYYDWSLGLRRLPLSEADSLADVYLLYWPRGQSPRTKFVDLRHPDVAFRFSDYWRRLVSIADDGRWAGVTIGGTLRVGRLDPDDPEISRQTTVIDLPEGAEVERLMHRRGGDILVVQFKDRTIRSYPAAGGAPLDTTQGGFDMMIGDHRVYGWNDATEGTIVFSVEADGTFTWEQWPFMAGVRDWGAVLDSPSGRYVVMKRRVWPGNVEYKIRKTPLADDDAPVPRITHPGSRDDQLGWLMGWLTW